MAAAATIFTIFAVLKTLATQFVPGQPREAMSLRPEKSGASTEFFASAFLCEAQSGLLRRWSLLPGSGWQPVADIAAQARRPVDLEAEERTSEFNLNKISRRAGTNSLLIVGYAGIVDESSFSWIDDPAGLPSG